ncbi:MAG: TrbG/VirB9 family P-type conjugative transfer protein [Alphaproteobacteria bacterium]|nr:TrbG/VirB9 family P-type conjugative transfer protein [Alphaproteobacteria bacterium]
MLSKSMKISMLSLLLILFSGEVKAQATISSMDQNADQSQGQYQPMDMSYAGFNSLGMMQSAWLDPLQNLGEGQSKPAYSKYYWSPDLVLPLRLREGMITMINFPEWEMIEDIYIGDNSTFDGQISGPSTLLLYPRKGANVGVDTNIIVFGRSGNRYVFYARSEGVNTERLTNAIVDIEVIGAESGGAGAIGGNGGSHVNASKYYGNSGKSVDSTFTKRNQKNSWVENIPLDPTKFRFDIEVYVPHPEDVVIAPERVWRDDIFTYIDLGAKSLNMTQRPIVTLIVERMEVPVGFRTKGPNNRLIIVEAIGDMVLRNGKRIVCLKLRRSDDAGLDDVSYADDITAKEWDRGAKIPGGKQIKAGSAEYPDFNSGVMGDAANYPSGQFDINIGGSEVIVPEYSMAGRGAGNANGYGANGDFDYSKMHRIQNTQQFDPAASDFSNRYKYGSGFADGAGSNISIELGTDANVETLENLWDSLSDKYSKILKNYDPFFSVDAPADGQGKELFHLRIGPVKTLDEGDGVCSKLGRNGVFCSVVRTQ